jgi:3-deoxy-7-phosphoheptulonate synthase
MRFAEWEVPAMRFSHALQLFVVAILMIVGPHAAAWAEQTENPADHSHSESAPHERLRMDFGWKFTLGRASDRSRGFMYPDNYMRGDDEFNLHLLRQQTRTDDASARCIREAGAHVLRGGACKPRSSPYSFDGLGRLGLALLEEARAATGLPIDSELLHVNEASEFARRVDMIQIGTRNAQNYDLIRAAAATGEPILLKRGMASTIEEWLLAAEYILSQGNPNVVLCERGIRTFDRFTRNTLDVSAIVVAKRETHLPVLADPSHAAGVREYVPGVAKAAIAGGADGLLIEVHPKPEYALCDGAQSLSPEEFQELMNDLRPLANALGRTL